jgi:hypothetical protein
MPTPRETILTALHAQLSALPATALRGEVLPERVPTDGLLILRDGEPGEPEITLSPLRATGRTRRPNGTPGAKPSRSRNWPRGSTRSTSPSE